MTSDLSTSKSQKQIARLGADIAKLHKSAWASAQSAIGTAIECGEKLLAAKETVAHGEWTGFVETHCRMSLRTAQRYMKAAKDETIKLPFFDEIPDPYDHQKTEVAEVPKSDNVSLLPTPLTTEMVVVPKSDPPIATPKIESSPEHTLILESDVEYEDCDAGDDIEETPVHEETAEICDRWRTDFDIEAAGFRLAQLVHHELDQWPHEHLRAAAKVLDLVVKNRIGGEVAS